MNDAPAYQEFFDFNSFNNAPGGCYNFSAQKTPPYIRIEAPRARSVLLNNVPHRLSFPYVVFLEPFGSRCAHFVFVTPNMPTWDSILYEFPLTWHLEPNEHKHLNVQNLSHIDGNGFVCYGPDAAELFGNPDKPMNHHMQLIFWGSTFSKLDGKFVIGKWFPLSKSDPAEAARVAVRSPVFMSETRGLGTVIAHRVKQEAMGVPVAFSIANMVKELNRKRYQDIYLGYRGGGFSRIAFAADTSKPLELGVNPLKWAELAPSTITTTVPTSALFGS